MSSLFARRFALHEDVRLTDAIKENRSNNVMRAGEPGTVVEFLDGDLYRVRMTGPVVSGYEVIASATQLEEVARTPRQSTLAVGDRLQGSVQRIAMRDGGGVAIALLTLAGRHETFVVHAVTSDEEFSMRLTQPGDKVRLTVKEADDNRPRANGFENLYLN